jgi:hypothetical protein
VATFLRNGRDHSRMERWRYPQSSSHSQIFQPLTMKPGSLESRFFVDDGLWKEAPKLTGQGSFTPLPDVRNIMVTGGEGFMSVPTFVLIPSLPLTTLAAPPGSSATSSSNIPPPTTSSASTSSTTAARSTTVECWSHIPTSSSSTAT